MIWRLPSEYRGSESDEVLKSQQSSACSEGNWVKLDDDEKAELDRKKAALAKDL